ncbi:hypothetical protein [Streptomyces murinus]|uniref:hypothetical protein n=1 Tax=Streptomyces murinus TaxID=33900 RepID=UPI0037F33C42
MVVAGRAAAHDVDAVPKRTQPGGSAVTAAARASDARQAVRDRTAVAGNAVEALRSALCFGGAGMLRPVLVLCAWIAAGIALLGLDARRHRHAARTGGRCRAPVTVLDPGGRQLVSTLANAHGAYAATGLPEGCLSVAATLPVVQQRPPRQGRTGGLPAAGP